MRRSALLALVAVLALPAAASAYHINAPAWPHHRIAYWSGYPGNPLVISRAVRAWNESGADLRFVRTPYGASQLKILGYPDPCQGFTVRSGARATVRLSRGGCRGPDEMARVAAHELGHVLGLGHEDRFCAMMNSKFHDLCALPTHDWQWRCRLLEPDDIRGAVRLYGGYDLFPTPPFCDRFPAVGPPQLPTATFSPTRGIVVRWRNVAEPHLADVSAGAGRTCPTRQPFVPRYPLPGTVHPGRPGSLTIDPTGPGDACVVLWSEDIYGRLGRPVRAHVTVPSLPPVAVGGVDPGPGPTLTLHGEESRDPDGGEIQRWGWYFGDGSPTITTAGPDVRHTYPGPGTYTATLAVLDDEGDVGNTQIPVRVGP